MSWSDLRSATSRRPPWIVASILCCFNAWHAGLLVIVRSSLTPLIYSLCRQNGWTVLSSDGLVVGSYTGLYHFAVHHVARWSIYIALLHGRWVRRLCFDTSVGVKLDSSTSCVSHLSHSCLLSSSWTLVRKRAAAIAVVNAIGNLGFLSVHY